ncbi:adenosylcobalamin-dependent ribonucleoside-diphosphate reductase [Rhodoferax sp.]|uniref:adenosylcobalamin-dependent ribonucleoside-diphosphate reductase n=1 Tax=Rhodoferax sp. TaxID=50421 RepID=UPI00271A5A73|nr:adenosylcobalamin-dependent ribonucleoside-diphosphate reductase [Rhodoferax sp.]MDO9145976.1 adenosylcobalamin-dependent ribonucleoside-diphosphate reductase [Rhodoferax sp.]MDP1528006.1 adenosylcobalamin-dependent ribonucleoside-diphosphate reductase [Rhodoferax sp.]MDP1942639.1 adenosylcobalamin-dependent ribonucleoside-diphosphate reductase [Rhodoferax sp.]MDP2439938.1 adenosylcobalamin-dependent ribonucleoside-diphosphate reductase [Rhodoferax sp.]MDP3864923.1 adenosylcobalamin-depende
MQSTHILEPISDHVWRTRYCWLEPGRLPEPSIEVTWDRVALAVSAAETHHRDEWRERFCTILHDFRFLPGGRILASAGTGHHSTLFNCFVAGPLEDSIQGIFNALREAMVTLQAGGGVGVDFSTLRPAGSPAVASAGVASGPVSFMDVWEAANTVLASHNVRRGAMMATLRCDHPDIEAFIDAKMAGAALAHFNLSVAISDDFMRAVETDGPWPLVFPLGQRPVPVGVEVCERIWSGDTTPRLCLVHRRVPARLIWDKLLAAQLACAEPGVLFIDRINRDNNLWYSEQIATTSPGGEVPLPPHGGCNLGSINLTRFVQDPFAAHPQVDWVGLKAVAGIATRFLDDVHDISLLPLKAQEKTVRASRRIGLGVTGLADMLAMLGLRYGSEASLDLTRALMGAIRDTAYSTSVEIAREKGAFPEFDKIKYGASPFVLGLSHELQDAIAEHGIRNSHLLAVAPAKAISLLANKVSSGIESTAADISPEAQLRMMSVVQSCVDSAISKTVHLPQGIRPQELELVLLQAWELGLKGCAVYREGRREGEAV